MTFSITTNGLFIFLDLRIEQSRCENSLERKDNKVTYQFLVGQDIATFLNKNHKFLQQLLNKENHTNIISNVVEIAFQNQRWRRWLSGLERLPRKRKVGCSNTSHDRP